MEPRRDPRTKEIINAVIAICLVIVAGCGYWWHCRKTAAVSDRQAQRNLQKLGEAVKRFYVEVEDMSECRGHGIPRLTENHIRYLVGSYYGWSGTYRKGKVLVHCLGNEVRACAERGTRQGEDGNHRKLYRIDLSSGNELLPTVGPCYGKEYGGRGKLCNTASMLRPNCTFKTEEEVEKHSPPCEKLSTGLFCLL